MKSILELVDYWFDNPNIWFVGDSTTDTLITLKYKHLLDYKYDGLDNLKQKLGLILLWDQISRHVYRNDPASVSIYHQKSLKLSQQLLNNGRDIELKPEQRWFVLMPLRHTFDKTCLEIVIERVREYMQKEGFEKHQRFYRATLLSYSKVVTSELVPEKPDLGITNDDITSILDLKSCNTIISISNKEMYRTKIYKKFKSHININRPEGITISISGGVDSMVCSYVLYHIRRKYPNIQIVAVMVNYNNRNTCNTETQFVTRWLKSLNIPVYIRHVKYLKRKNDNDPTDRNFYEKITKEFRFDLYRRFGYPVILGHNKDDSIENIFTNIRKGRNYDNLKGMKSIGLINDITFYRPLLDISKCDIYKFAHEHRIPFLVDSTPSWSDRGRMRDHLIPLLNDFDPSLIPGLIRLSENTTQLYKNQTILIEQLKETIIFGENKAEITISADGSEKKLGFEFWKQVVRYICNNMSINMCSNKSIYSLVKCFQSNKSKRINLSKYLEVVMPDTDSLIFIANRF